MDHFGETVGTVAPLVALVLGDAIALICIVRIHAVVQRTMDRYNRPTAMARVCETVSHILLAVGLLGLLVSSFEAAIRLL